MEHLEKKINIVTVGGGNGSAISLRALKKMSPSVTISAVISASDSGGSSGDLRREFATLPPGDILRAVLALAPYEYADLKKIFHTNRFFSNPKLAEHNLGNLVFVLLEQYAGDFISAVRAFEEIVESRGKVYPATLNFTDLAVELDDGQVLTGETKIDRPLMSQVGRIKRAWLAPDSEIYSGAAGVLRSADYIIFGPGSLYTSIIAATLPRGFKEIILASSARLIYVSSSAYEVNGERGPRKLSESVSELEKCLPRPIDVVVYNSHAFTEQETLNYTRKGSSFYEYDISNLRAGTELHGEDIESLFGGIDPEKLQSIFKKIIWK